MFELPLSGFAGDRKARIAVTGDTAAISLKGRGNADAYRKPVAERLDGRRAMK